ncbi:hypothetical protein CPT76_33465, partial [Paenibacillus sp. AR247]
MKIHLVVSRGCLHFINGLLNDGCNFSLHIFCKVFIQMRYQALIPDIRETQPNGNVCCRQRMPAKDQRFLSNLVSY